MGYRTTVSLRRLQGATLDPETGHVDALPENDPRRVGPPKQGCGVGLVVDSRHRWRLR